LDLFREADTLIKQIRAQMSKLDKLIVSLEKKDEAMDSKLKKVNDLQNLLEQMLSRAESEARGSTIE